MLRPPSDPVRALDELHAAYESLFAEIHGLHRRRKPEMQETS
jgi:hypothetical protein